MRNSHKQEGVLVTAIWKAYLITSNYCFEAKLHTMYPLLPHLYLTFNLVTMSTNTYLVALPTEAGGECVHTGTLLVHQQQPTEEPLQLQGDQTHLREGRGREGQGREGRGR